MKFIFFLNKFLLRSERELSLFYLKKVPVIWNRDSNCFYPHCTTNCRQNLVSVCISFSGINIIATKKFGLLFETGLSCNGMYIFTKI